VYDPVVPTNNNKQRLRRGVFPFSTAARLAASNLSIKRAKEKKEPAAYHYQQAGQDKQDADYPVSKPNHPEA
jgi:hypothetical protein